MVDSSALIARYVGKYLRNSSKRSKQLRRTKEQLGGSGGTIVSRLVETPPPTVKGKVNLSFT